MSKGHFDLAQSAYHEMIQRGFHPDFPPDAMRQVADLRKAAAANAVTGQDRDMRGLPWSSIDNDTSRDLDQIELAERTSDGIRVRVGIADVDRDVPYGSPIDEHARAETTSVYTPARTFAMLPEALSTDLTSLNPHQDRSAVVIEFVVSADGQISQPEVYCATVRNQFQLTYNGIGAWLDGDGNAPPSVGASAELAAQLKLQDAAARLLREQRHKLGALVVRSNRNATGLERWNGGDRGRAAAKSRERSDRRLHDCGQRSHGADFDACGHGKLAARSEIARTVAAHRGGCGDSRDKVTR